TTLFRSSGKEREVAIRGGVPLCGCQWIFCLRWAVQRPVPEHGEQDIAAPTSERDEGLVMTFALADFARVVSPGDRVAQRCEGRQEQRALELLVSSPRRMLSSDGGARASRDGREPCISRQMRRRGERTGRHVDQESGGGPDADSWPACHD